MTSAAEGDESGGASALLAGNLSNDERQLLLARAHIVLQCDASA